MLQPPMQYSDTGLSLTEREEALRLVGYIPGPGDVPTNGYGHTGPDVFVGQQITRWQAVQWLKADVAKAEAAVNASVNVALYQHEFDSLVDFTFNVGVHAFETSHLLKYLNQGNKAAANEQFDSWIFVKGTVNKGLQNRRDAEQAEFLG
jgi:lysozyme